MRVIAMTGSASGIGAATRKAIEARGDRVVGIDLRDAEVIADLATPDGRQAALGAVVELSGGRLDGLVVCAGIGPQVEPLSQIVSLNYFGAVKILEGLRRALAGGQQSAVVVVSSNSSTIPGADSPLVDTCLAGDEDEARRMALTLDGHRVYSGSKLALTRWMRRNAPGSDWAGMGIRLNAVAPGAVLTPLLQAGLDHPDYGPAIRSFPIPTGGFARPDQIAPAVTFLLSSDAAFCCGSVFFVDGGSDAMLRPESY